MQSRALIFTMLLVLVATLVVVPWLGSVATGGDDENPNRASRRITVELLRSSEHIAGIEVPEGLAGKNSEYLRETEPSNVTVALPDGSKKSLTVTYASIHVQAGVAVDVHLLPLAKSAPYKHVIVELHRLLTALDIQPDARMKEHMAGWPDDVPKIDTAKWPGAQLHTYRAVTQLSDDASLFVELRPMVDGDWSLALTFEATGPERRAVWEKWAAQSSTRPASRSGKKE